MKCMHEYNCCKMFSWIHDVIQNDEISMRNKDIMNAYYVICYKRFIGVWSLIRNAYNALKRKHNKREKG